MEAWHHAMVASECHKYKAQMEVQALLMPVLASSKSDSSVQLMGVDPQPPARIGSGEEAGGA